MGIDKNGFDDGKIQNDPMCYVCHGDLKNHTEDELLHCIGSGSYTNTAKMKYENDRMERILRDKEKQRYLRPEPTRTDKEKIEKALEVIDDFMAGYDYDNPVADRFKNIKKILED